VRRLRAQAALERGRSAPAASRRRGEAAE